MAFYRAFRNKYNASKTVYNGTYYDSKLEASYAMYLDTLKAGGIVKDYQTQVVLHLTVNGIQVCTYRVDFVVTYTDGHIEYVETKGFWTDTARLKVKLAQAVLGIKVKVVKSIPLR